MHQTFYIDIDEEITSIVDRLRKAKTREVVVVVPKRASLIQSIVNLKLLKKEADGLNKDLIIVTQDKLGKMLLENTGISVEQKLDDIGGEEASVRDEESVEEEDRAGIEAENTIDLKSAGIGSRLENIGSAEYFEEANVRPKSGFSEKVFSEEKKKRAGKGARPDEVFQEEILGSLAGEEKIINKELVTDIGRNIRKSGDLGGLSSMDIVKNVNIKQTGLPDFTAEAADSSRTKKQNIAKKKPVFAKENLRGRKSIGGEKIGEFFQNDKMSQKKRDNYGNVNLSGGFWKFFLLFGSIAAGIILIIIGYLFLPKTDIKIFTKAKTQSVDAEEINGLADSASVDAEAKSIPSRIVSGADELSGNFSATGGKSVSSRKARGTITIYNEYSGSPQPLVATTRFLSENGKIFRLVKSAVVPGTTNIGGEMKPGAIEADVIADEAGEDYNIEPATFTIPGFQGSGTEKYSKFYAKSFKKMSGGGSVSETVKTISSSDISGAKSKLAGELAQALRQKMKEEAGGDMIILDDALNTSDAAYILSAAEGEAADNFTVTVKMKAGAVAFSGQDLKSVIGAIIARAGDGKNDIEQESLSLEFGKSDADFSSGNILIRVNAQGTIKPNIDLENLKKGILGKSESDFKAYLETYPEIERVEINYWPPFISGKIPAYASRVSLKLDNN